MNKLSHFALGLLLAFGCACNSPSGSASASAAPDAMPAGGGQASVKDDVSQKDVVKVAMASPDHTTLVKAVQAADLVNALSNAGPFTVFAPVNDAFAKLPPGTVEGLLKPEQKTTLQDILQYHVAVAVYRPEMLRDGMTLGMANGGNVRVSVQDGKIRLNDAATVVATVPASNGIVHVIDGVLLPQ
ncbi:MAG: fasciclin domain-containing protein [Bacteroidia bacterium]|nr:fasciclin domain-containing protein [Bacteroidia bacterium]